MNGSFIWGLFALALGVVLLIAGAMATVPSSIVLLMLGGFLVGHGFVMALLNR